MKNTVYALARQDPIHDVETFAARLAEHFLAKPAVTAARISAVEQPWGRLSSGGQPHPHAFVQAGAEHWTTVVTRDARGSEIVSGLANLVVLKTTDSAFSGFPRDEYTTLPDAGDRIMATSITAAWTYRPGTTDFSARAKVRRALVEVFASHLSRSVQHTRTRWPKPRSRCADVTGSRLLPNRHHLLVDLSHSPDNPNETSATDQPFGLIEHDRALRTPEGFSRAEERPWPSTCRRRLPACDLGIRFCCPRRPRPNRSPTSCARSRPGGAVW
jgi:urate oxidase